MAPESDLSLGYLGQRVFKLDLAKVERRFLSA